MFRTPYDGQSDCASLESGLHFDGPGRTQQQFRDECDINTIVRRFGVTGQLPVPVRLPTYDDFTQVRDFQSAMQAVRDAEESFAALPSDLRSRFANDPQQLLEFLGDAKNRAEAEKLGLVNPAPPPPAPPPAG